MIDALSMSSPAKPFLINIMKKKWNELTLQKLCVCSCIELHVVTIPEAAS